MKVELTILVAMHNAQTTIIPCLSSLVECSIPLRVVVLDDGSTDNSCALVREFAVKYPQVKLLTQENKGIAAARNQLLKEVNTPYFGFLDSDDTVRPLVYETLLSKMKKEQSDIGFSDFLWLYDNGSTKRACDTGYLTTQELITKMFATLWNKLYRTEWFLATGLTFPEGYRYEDASLLYRLALHMHKISYLSEISVNYFQRKGSITHSFDMHIDDMLVVFAGIREYYKHQGNVFEKELEYLFIRFFLGNSYLRACRISDKKLRKETLQKAYTFLLTNYPNYRQNPYLRQGGKKNLYYRLMNKPLYFFLPSIFRLLYRVGVMPS